MAVTSFQDPARDCALCPRLASFRAETAVAHPDWWNAPVPSFGGLDASLMVLGLAPGLRGANRTGRPFTGDWAGDLLYAVLIAEGLAKGTYDQRPDDGLTLTGCRIANAVRCRRSVHRPHLRPHQELLRLGLVAHVSMAHPVCPRLGDHLEAPPPAPPGSRCPRRDLSGHGRPAVLDPGRVGAVPDLELRRHRHDQHARGQARPRGRDLLRHRRHGHRLRLLACPIKTLLENADHGKDLVRRVAAKLNEWPTVPDCGCDKALDNALITAPDARDPNVLAKLDAVAGRVL
jgi:hypothetical protein